jgi:hypothetical protein
MEKLRKWKKGMKFMKGLRVNSDIKDKGHAMSGEHCSE